MEVAPDFRLDFTTQSGEKMFIRPSTLEELAKHGLKRSQQDADASQYHCFLVRRQADAIPVTALGIEHLTDPSDGIVLDVRTEKAEQRKHYAEDGLRSLIEWANKQGISHIGADPTGGEPAIELLKKLDFKPVGPTWGRWLRDRRAQS